jgi:predicted outer membrane repeat protein
MRFDRPVIAPLVLVASLLLATTSMAADRYVPDQHASIAAALNVSQAGDRILVRPGVYLEFGIALKAGVAIAGLGATPAEVVIDGGHQGRILRAINLSSAATLTNLTISNGNAFGASFVEGSGGALLARNSDLLLTKVRFIGNRATASGGAVRALTAHPVFVECDFQDNRANLGGGALDGSYDSILEITNSRFRGNQAAWGGATSIRNRSRATILRSDFASNVAVQFPALGGGIYTDHGAQVSLQFCSFVANSALYGGAVSADREALVTISNCTMRLNLGAYDGGGLYLKAATPVIDHSLLAANTGHAIRCAAAGRAPTLSACDLWGNTGGNWDGQIESQRDLRANSQVNPLFCGDDDQHLAANSPCAEQNSGIGLIGALGVGCGRQEDGGVDAEPDTVSVGEPLMVSPNPFNPQTTISFEVASPGLVRVRIHDLRGAVVATLIDAVLPSGRQSVPWKGVDDHGRLIASGTYLVSFQSPTGLVTKKILVAR